MALKAVTTFMTLAALFTIAFFLSVAMFDPLVPIVQGFDLGGMGGQVTDIHVALVKYIVPVFLGSILVWAVLYILREERQTVR